MKVFVRTKTGKTVAIDPNQYPVAIQLTNHDKSLIKHMSPNAHYFSAYPEETDSAEIKAWLEELKSEEDF